jgi:hypothetical protein
MVESNGRVERIAEKVEASERLSFEEVVEFSIRPEHVDTVTKWYDDVVIPAARKTGGLKGAILLINRQTGKGIGMGFWETKGDADAYEASGALRGTLQKLNDQGVSFTSSPVRTEYTVEHADLEFMVS